jgi:hypothetical protein
LDDLRLKEYSFRLFLIKKTDMMKNIGFLIAIVLLFAAGGYSQTNIIPFDKEHWDLTGAKVTEYLGRPALSGTAFLKSPLLENGVIEFDLAVTGQRSYPGVLFRAASPEDYERIYLRPHLPAVFQNVVQYVAAYNGIDSWQLYTGPGHIASAEIPKNQWFHVRIEFKGAQARVFLSGDPVPVLEIDHLDHGPRSGSMGLYGPLDGSAWFSNFTCREDNNLQFKPEQSVEPPYGTLQEWQISAVYRMSEIDNEMTPEAQ